MVEARAMDAVCFVPVGIIGRTWNGDTVAATDPALAAGTIEIGKKGKGTRSGVQFNIPI